MRYLLVAGWATLLLLTTACGPSDADVAQAAEETAARLAANALSNVSCSISEAFSGGGPATAVMERYTARIDRLTGELETGRDAGNREEMKVINEMNDLAKDWENALDEIGCAVSAPE